MAPKSIRTPKNAGRPSLYTDVLADSICNYLIDGLSLVKICDKDSMPHRSTVMRWLSEYPDFATKYARARDAQADLMDDKILDVADASTSETAAADRVKIAAYQWRASKLQPKKYGDKLDMNLSGSVSMLTEGQLDARITELLGKTGAGEPS